MSAKRQPPRLIPVLDVMNGQVVRAVGGRRDEYRPVVSKLTTSTESVEVTKALISATGAEELYVADLDAIRAQTAAFWELFEAPDTTAPLPALSPPTRELLLGQRKGPEDRQTEHIKMSQSVRTLLDVVDVPVWVDAGLTGSENLWNQRLIPKLRYVFGLESSTGIAAAKTGTAHNLNAFSIDFNNGILLGAWAKQSNCNALDIARSVVEAGFHTIIVLDLSRVGTGTGTGTEPLLKAIRAEFPGIDLIAGGGVRTWEDVDRLGEAGATGVLVASALHDGTLTFPRPTS